jgi:gliding motility-associated-like protein
MKARLLIFLFFAIFKLNAQSLFYISPSEFTSNAYYSFGLYDIGKCKDSVIIHSIDGLGIYDLYTDIAFCPDNNFYIIGVDLVNFENSLLRLNLQDSTVSKMTNYYYNANSLTCSSDSVLFLGGNRTSTYDLKTMTYTDYNMYGNFASLSGDLTFVNGKLYGTTFLNELIEIDYLDSTKNKIIFQYPIGNLKAPGVISLSENCDSSLLYITATDALSIPSIGLNQIFSIDLKNQTTTFVCNTNRLIYGAASPSEFKSSDCTIRFDLDANNSSTATGKNYLANPSCLPSALGIPICDTTDTKLSAAVLRIDSLQITILGMPSNLYLTATAIGNTVISNQNSSKITLVSDNIPDFLITNFDLKQSLKSARLNANGVATDGIYQIAVFLFGEGNRRDTAFCNIEIFEKPTAGKDSTLQFCQQNTLVNLQNYLSSNASNLGNWFPSEQIGLQNTGNQTVFYFVAAANCPSDTAVFMINVNPLPQFSLGGDTVVCQANGLNLTLTAPNSNTTWSNNNTGISQNLTQPGLYWAESTDTNGCIWRDSIIISYQAPVQVNQNLSLCKGQIFQWNNEAFVSDTMICRIFTTPNGCDSTVCITLIFNYNYLNVDSAICEGQNLIWNNQIINQAGIFRDTVLVNGCATIREISVQILPKPTFLITGDSLVCSLNSGQIFVQTDFLNQIIWSTGENSNSITVQQSGDYSFTLTNSEGCLVIGNQTFAVQPPFLTEWQSQSPSCFTLENGSINLTSISGEINPVSFQLNAQNAVSNPQFNDLPAGKYQILTTDALGCTDLDSFTLAVPTPFFLSLGADTIIDEGQSYSIPVSLNQNLGLQYTWIPTDGLSCEDCPNPIATPSESIIYQLLVTDSTGCSDSDSLKIIVRKSLKIYAPNSFSPNDDGFNDFFTLFGSVEFVENIEKLQIFDRWGELVFERKNLEVNQDSNGWDGTFRNKKLPSNVYLWTAEVRLKNGEIIPFKGDLTLIR